MAIIKEKEDDVMEQPLVSVVIPVYNRENTILRAIDSVLRQTYTNIEIIVVDDCSIDSTVNLISSCNDERIRVICLSRNQGANYARNRGIENARGEFIAFQDSDDEWLENKLDKQIKYMLDERLEAVFCPYILCDGAQCYIVPNDYQNSDIYITGLQEKLKRGNVVGTPTLIVKRDVFHRIGMFDEEMARLQDYEFVIRLIKKYRLGYIDEPLVKAYRLGKSISTNEDAFIEAYKRLAEKHSDFIELECVIDSIFNYTTIFRDGKINWGKFDGLIEIIRNELDCKTQKDFYKLIVEYLYKRYFPVRRMVEDWYAFYTEFIRTKEFAIYGAGKYGKKAYDDIKRQNCIPRYFLVTEQNGQSEMEGVPVVELSADISRDIPVIIAVSWEKQNELIKNLQNLGIYRFCIYPFC